MRRLEANAMWSLFDPEDVRPLTNLVGSAFEAAYESYERDGLALATVPAKVLWDTVSAALRESGSPFIMFSDNINGADFPLWSVPSCHLLIFQAERNNQMHLGVIKASNLCTEIVQYSSTVETAVCTLAALCLPRFVQEDGSLDYEELHRVTKIAVRILNKVIDRAHFPTSDSAVLAYGTRSIGIGTQGLADVFAGMELPFTSQQAQDINVQISETVYHASLDSSCELAEVYGPHDMWEGSPAVRGALQVDMWNAETSDRHDFAALHERIEHFGLRNSMLTAQMPTASTAQLLGHSEGIEPYTRYSAHYLVLVAFC